MHDAVERIRCESGAEAASAGRAKAARRTHDPLAEQGMNQRGGHVSLQLDGQHVRLDPKMPIFRLGRREGGRGGTVERAKGAGGGHATSAGARGCAHVEWRTWRAMMRGDRKMSSKLRLSTSEVSCWATSSLDMWRLFA